MSFCVGIEKASTVWETVGEGLSDMLEAKRTNISTTCTALVEREYIPHQLLEGDGKPVLVL